MSSEQDARIEVLLADLAPLGEEERSREIDRRCADDPELAKEVRLRLSSAATFSDTPVTAGAGFGPTLDPTGASIAGYRIRKRLGQGGMGAVYEAEQENPRRSVALKLLRAETQSEEMMLRFAREAHVLGRLQHPGIAQIHEAGRGDLVSEDTVIADQPFIAMELVDGQTLVEHADHQALSSRRRLELFVAICAAVQHAHQQGVIHRDLKPANILVTRAGEPKILDFGIARLESTETRDLTLETELGRIVGTLAYMSPEQIRGDSRQIDTRSDVYALGVVLYELLSGELPIPVHGVPVPVILREIQERRPPSLSQLRSELKGDVSTIVAKALEKDPSQRFSSAAELGEDIRRALDDEPISARKPTGAYLLIKFARRHRAVVAATLVAVLGLVLGPTYGLIRVQDERDLALDAQNQAVAELETALEVTDFLVDTLKSARPEESGVQVTVREVLDAAAPSLENRFENRPLVEARLREAIGSTYLELNEIDVAREYLERARAIYEQEYEPGHRSTLRTRFDLARLTFESGDRQLGLEQLEALMAEEPAKEASEDFRQEMDLQLASHFRSFDRADEAVEIYRKLLALRISRHGELHPDVAWVQRELGTTLANQGNHEEGLPLLEEAVRNTRRIFGKDHARTSRALHPLAVTKRVLGRHDEAVEHLLEVVDIHRRLYGERHQVTARSMLALAAAYHELGRYEEAEALAREALTGLEVILGPEHPNVGEALRELGVSQFAQGDYDEAEKTQRRALSIYRASSGVSQGKLAVLLDDLGLTLARSGRPDEARPWQEEALKEARAAFGDKHPTTLTLLENLASTVFRLNEYPRSAEMLEEVLAGRRESLGEDHTAVTRTLYNTAAVTRSTGDLPRAAELFEEALERFRRELGDEHPNVLATLESLAAIARKKEAYEEAQRWLRLRCEIFEASSGVESPRALAAQADLADSLERSGDTSGALEVWRGAHDVADEHEVLDWVSRAKQALIRIHEKRGEAEEAARWR